MEEIKIRPFKHSDLEDVIHIAQHSFAEEMVAQGVTQAHFIQRIRTVMRGYMIPFKLLAKLTGIKMGFFVAELNGRIVGFAAYQGQKQLTLTNLMVDPSFRRRGVGQALLQARLHALKEKDVPHVTTTILADNQASLGNVKKQGFQIFDQYVVLERPLPLPPPPLLTKLSSRWPKSADKPAFQQLENSIIPSELFKIEGSRQRQYFPPPQQIWLNSLTGTQTNIQAHTLNNKPITFTAVFTSKQQTKGTVARPLIAPEHINQLPYVLYEISNWLTSHNKQHIQIALPTVQEQAITQMQQSGWTQTQSWLRLIKYLD